MLKLFLPLLMYCLLMGCGLQQSFKKLNQINKHLQTTFKHNEITTSRGWGSDKGGNYIAVLFFNFDVDKKPYDEVKILAANVRQELIGKYVELGKMDFIEVKFTLDALKTNTCTTARNSRIRSLVMEVDWSGMIMARGCMMRRLVGGM